MNWESAGITESQPTHGAPDASPIKTVAETSVGVGNTLVYVDADNQSPALAKPLIHFLEGVGRKASRIFIVGNGSGDRVSAWEGALKDINPHAQVAAHVAPMRKQSADVRLMFELATLYHGKPDRHMLALIVSRDDLLLAAAECLYGQGHHVLVAVGSSTPSAPLATELPVVVLPLPQAVAQSTPKEAAPAPPEPTKPAVSSVVDAQVVKSAIVKIRQALSQSKGGGYGASAVGQVLSQMGHDKAMRTKIVRSIPNLRETGVGPDKRLIF